MAKRQAYFEGIARITLEHETGAPTSQLKQVDIRLELGKQDKEVFFDGKGQMRKAACKPLTQCFIQGLVANVKNGHAKGWWDQAEHMKYIIDQLGRAFVEPTGEPFGSTMNYKPGEHIKP